ncbi:MAG: Stk1 family PASTA domain-containing Ser/Thr kinase [Actinomycetota bacterium]
MTLDGRYHVIEKVAAGGMGEVFRARDAVLAREVAIKVLHRSLSGDQGFVDRFRREARAAATLNHPNIVAVYDWGSVDGIYYMVMEYVRGRGVRDLLNANHRLAPVQAAEILDQTLIALEHAHGLGLVHRDLKPENILVTNEGVVKLTDLGLARAYADSTATHAGTVVGTVQYLSPEQIRGEPSDPRSDLYALGIVTYELLTGRLPFTGETPMAIAYKHLSDQIPAPSSQVPGIPPELDAFVASATERNRELRPESAAEMRRDLRSIAPTLTPARSLAALVADTPEVTRGGDPTERVVAATTQAIPQVERTTRRRGKKFLVVLLAIAAVLAGGWAAWTYAVPHHADVPRMLNTPLAGARSQLEALGFVVKVAPGEYSLKIPAGSVYRVKPAVGTSLAKGATVTIIPSLGPPPVPVPSVVQEALAKAQADIRDADLNVGKVSHDFSETVPKGRVISQDPAHGKAPQNSDVTLVVSEGPPPVTLPSVVGKTQDAATAALSAKEFTVTVSQAFSNSVKLGFVISQSPATAQAPHGSAVTIVVSQGPPTFHIASYLGMTRDAALAAIVGDGLHADVRTLPSAYRRIVVGQAPTPGTIVRAGDTVIIFIG